MMLSTLYVWVMLLMMMMMRRRNSGAEMSCGIAHYGEPYASLSQCGLVEPSIDNLSGDNIALPSSRRVPEKMQDSPYNFVSVEWYGAVGDGVTNDTQAFVDAWVDACSLNDSTLLVPQGFTYLVSAYEFKGPCGSSLTFELEGTLKAPSDPKKWMKNSSNTWILFSRINNLVVKGGGTIDGQGQLWWNQSCKVNKKNPCHDAPTALKFEACKNIKLINIESKNSQQIHTGFHKCEGVHVSNIQINAPQKSPNTDGIHISKTQNVVIDSSTIGTGDDCVSIVSGSSNIKIKNITCGPGHGISIGSLGKDSSEDYVSLVVVDGATLQGTTNGLRIKTWQGGSGYAIGFRFQNINMVNVSYPIIIDQYYCDSKDSCSTDEKSAVQVSNVVYSNIYGTSLTREAVKFQCSDFSPCQNVRLENINLTLASNYDDTISTCQSAQGISYGTLIPPSCLQSYIPSHHNYSQHPHQPTPHDEL